MFIGIGGQYRNEKMISNDVGMGRYTRITFACTRISLLKGHLNFYKTIFQVYELLL
jgi:hypothetical protein